MDEALGYGSSPKYIWGFPFNIYTMAEARGFKFGTQLGFAKATIKWAWPWVMEAPCIWGSPLIFLQRRAVLLALAELLVLVTRQTIVGNAAFSLSRPRLITHILVL